MNKEVLAKRSTATLNQTVAIILIVTGVLFIGLGIGLFTLAIRNNDPMVVRVLLLVLFSILGIAFVTFGIIQIFDNDENNRLGSFPLLSYSKEEDSYYAYDLYEGGNEIIFKKDELIKLVGPSLFTFGRVYLKYQKDGVTKRAFIGFAKGKNAEIVSKIK